MELVRENGGQFPNTSRLFKAFWKAHLYFAQRNPGYLSAWPMIRLPNGPGIDAFNLLLGEMLADGWLTIEETEGGGNLVLVLGPAYPTSTLPESALEAIRVGVQLTDDNSYRESRVWHETKDGDVLDIYLDLMSDAERDQREANLAALAAAIGPSYSTSRK